MIKLKRAYDEPSKEDGLRVLVDRLWPRGVTKERAAIDLWLREVAPSAELRKWFNHDPAKWPEFRRRYLAELAQAPAQAALKALREAAAKGKVTLIYSAHDEEHNAALVLHEYLERRGSLRRAA